MHRLTHRLSEEDSWLALSLVPGLPVAAFHRIVGYCGGASQALAFDSRKLQAERLLSETACEALQTFEPERAVDEERRRMEKIDARAVLLTDADYPVNLRVIDDPPPVIFVRGNLLRDDVLAVAVVGTRRPSNYGRQLAEKLGRGLAAHGVAVVSGMAHGIDSQAHRGALAAGGRTIGVLGNGLDVVYPPEHRELQEQVARQGALISEFPMKTKPASFNFPQRNRIISGLGLGTVVVEAAAKSGALITAKFALDQNRDLFAVPGNVTSKLSRGTNDLLKQGATLVTSEDDIIESLPWYTKKLMQHSRADRRAIMRELSDDDQQVFGVVSNEEKHIDAIIEEAKLPASLVSGILVRLELLSLVKQFRGKMYVRTMS